MELIRLENVKKIYQTGEVITKAVDGIDFTVDQGEFAFVPDEHANGVMKLLHARKGQMEDMISKEGTGHTFIQAYIPTREMCIRDRIWEGWKRPGKAGRECLKQSAGYRMNPFHFCHDWSVACCLHTCLLYTSGLL